MSDVGLLRHIVYETTKANAYVLEEGLKPTQRFLLGVLQISYVSSNDFKAIIKYKRDNADAEKELTYDIKAGENLWRQKLPPGLLASEFKIRVEGDICYFFELKSIGVLYKIVNVGFGRTR